MDTNKSSLVRRISMLPLLCRVWSRLFWSVRKEMDTRVYFGDFTDAFLQSGLAGRNLR